jgi:hypothetical protein
MGVRFSARSQAATGRTLQKFASGSALTTGAVVWSHKFGQGVLTEVLPHSRKPYTAVFSSGAVAYSTKLAMSKLFLLAGAQPAVDASDFACEDESESKARPAKSRSPRPAKSRAATPQRISPLSLVSASESNIHRSQPARATENALSSHSSHNVSRTRSGSRASLRSPSRTSLFGFDSPPQAVATLDLDLPGFLRAWNLERIEVALAELGAVEPIDLLDLDQGVTVVARSATPLLSLCAFSPRLPASHFCRGRGGARARQARVQAAEARHADTRRSSLVGFLNL